MWIFLTWVAIRYPRGEAFSAAKKNVYANSQESVTDMEMLMEGKDVCVAAIGNMVEEALEAAESLQREGMNVSVVNVKQIWPFPVDAIKKIIDEYSAIITIEDGIYNGSFGEYAKSISGKVIAMTYPTKFIEHGSVKEIKEKYGMDAQGIINTVKNAIRK